MMKNLKQKLKHGVVAGMAFLASAVAMAGTYMPDVSTEVTAIAGEAKTMGSDTFGSIFPIIAYFVGMVIVVKVFRKFMSKIG